MIVDISAVVAILYEEPEASEFVQVILAASAPEISAASLFEAGLVIDGNLDPALSQRLDSLVDELSLSVTPFTEEQAAIARAAYRRYGRGSGHAAKLNFGDCFAYALATERNAPLLFKGNDFDKTDVGRV